MSTEQCWTPLHLTPDHHDVAPTRAGFEELVTRRVDLGSMLAAHKAIVFGGFDIGLADLNFVIDHVLPNRLAYRHGNTPRTNTGDNVYTSTEYPADQSISLHSELSYAHSWPDRLAFWCERPATVGGATSVASTSGWLEALDPEVKDAFSGGVRYVQNLHGGHGLGKSWQDTFETHDRSEVERFLSAGAAEWDWSSDGVRVTQVRPATIVHPETGLSGWFNQVDQWHSAGLPDPVREALLELLSEDELPQTVTFADGGAIPDEYVRHVRDVGWQCAFDVQWSAGDLLLVDNVAAAHARRPFRGDRRILVAMSSAG